jgi:hypothetical protein
MTIDAKVMKVLFDAGISRVIDWLEKKNWTLDIDYCNRDEMQPEARQITINARQGVEKQLYSLLHECGHLLVQQNWERYETSYPATAKMYCYATTNRQLEGSKKYKVDILSEEIEAWRRGKSLASRLGIYINEEKYNELTSECIYSYILWAAK